MIVIFPYLKEIRACVFTTAVCFVHLRRTLSLELRLAVARFSGLTSYIAFDSYV